MQCNIAEPHARNDQVAIRRDPGIITNERGAEGKTYAITAENPDTRLRNAKPSHKGCI